MNLSKNAKVSQVLGYFAAGTTERESDILDMEGFEGIMFIAELGTLIEAGTVDVVVEQNTINSDSGMAQVAGTAVHTLTAANATNTHSCIVVDVYRPLERYVKCTITPASQNAVILGITAIQYGAKKLPITNGTSNLLTTTIISPAEA